MPPAAEAAGSAGAAGWLRLVDRAGEGRGYWCATDRDGEGGGPGPRRVPSRRSEANRNDAALTWVESGEVTKNPEILSAGVCKGAVDDAELAGAAQ